MRISQMLLPTVKEDPAGAEAVSHKLMVRAGLVRQLSAGVYVYLPAGWRVMQKTAAIIREEMDGIGCQELLMPVINPAELWELSGRYNDIGDELFRLKDRKGSPLVLAMTHEECITWIASHEVRSYKQLPQLWYHIQTKERDEARPKSGILRTREFIMKDSYSLDVDEEGLRESYRKHIGAYDRIFSRCGLRFLMVQSDPGMMGGRIAHEYMAPSEAGEDDVVFCRECGYAANVELAAGRPQPLAELPPVSERTAGSGTPATLPPADAPAAERLRLVHTPGTRTIAEVTAFLGVPAQRLVKSLIVVCEPPEDAGVPAAAGTAASANPVAGTAASADLAAASAQPVGYMVLVRGDHELQESKLRRLIGDFRMASADEVLALQGAPAGFVGPVRLGESAPAAAASAPSASAAGGFAAALGASGAVLEVTGLPILADEALKGGVYVTGANQEDHHLLGVVPADWGAAVTEPAATGTVAGSAGAVAGADRESAAGGAGEGSVGGCSTAQAPRWVDVRRVVQGDGCLQCAGELQAERVIEIGNIFQLGTKYSIPMGATYLDEDGAEHPIVMGSYGIGLARIAAAAVEQHHDKDGIIWPATIAPWHVHLVCVKPADPVQHELADRLYEDLQGTGLEVVYDDRDTSPGIKFKDADLLGCPLQIVVGKKAGEGVVEVKQRAGEPGGPAEAGVPAGPGARGEAPAAEAAATVRARIEELLAALA
jgi:prolyl-tRNA synthetase